MGEAIALGFCNNVDYEIDFDVGVLSRLAAQYQIRGVEIRPGIEIRGERDLVISILAFMQADQGGERFVADSALIERFAGHFNKRITLGGTSVRAAIAMQKLGQPSALHLITLNEHVRRLIPAESPYVCSNQQDSLYPHLIVQFGAGDHARAGDIDIRAARANRLIYHCNADRLAMKINPDFADLIADARVMLVSGLNAMQDAALLQRRLATLRRLLEALPAAATLFLEDGGYHSPGFRRQLIGALGPRLNIYSMNEDEFQAQLGRGIRLDDSSQTLAALAELHKRLGIPTLVLHTAEWALAYGDGAGHYAEALRAGLTMATTRFRHGDSFTRQHYQHIAETAPLASAARFAADINASAPGLVCCMPVRAVDQSDATTIGLGDAFVGGFLPALV